MHACQKSPLAQNHIRVHKLETLSGDMELQRDHLVFKLLPLDIYFKLESFSYITMIPQCALVASDCGVSSRPCFMFDPRWLVLTHRHIHTIGNHTPSLGEAHPQPQDVVHSSQ